MIDGSNTKPWFRDDLIRILIGINLASRASLPAQAQAGDFRRGFALALTSLAIAIGIQPERILQADELAALLRPPEPVQADGGSGSNLPA